VGVGKNIGQLGKSSIKPVGSSILNHLIQDPLEVSASAVD
jgi:hypothetical protein